MQHQVIDSVEASAYTIPTDAPEADGTLAWDSTTLVLVSVRSGQTTGIGWTYGPPACARLVNDGLSSAVVGHDPMGVPRIWTGMTRSIRNATRAGVAQYAVSAVDVACWDLKARLLGVSLVDLFGSAQEEVAVYGSGGFTSYTDHQLSDQLRGWVNEQRIPRVKIKIGQDRGNNEPRDLARIHLARQVIGAEPELYVDANGAYSAKQAIRVLRGCSDARVSWYEEPVSSDNLAGLRMVRQNVDADVTAGEYGSDPGYFQRMCAAGAVDCLQIDATRCGGYSGWFRAAAVAAAHELSVSAHCAPNLHAHACAATPNLRHLEYFHDHARIETLAFDGVLDPEGGVLHPRRGTPGHGIAVRQDALAPYRV